MVTPAPHPALLGSPQRGLGGVKTYAQEVVLPDQTRADRPTVVDFAEMLCEATGAAATHWEAGEILKRMVAIVQAADAVLSEAYRGDVTAVSARVYETARVKVRLSA